MYLEGHAMKPLPISQWPDDDGPYFDEAAYGQVILEHPTPEEQAAFWHWIDRKRRAGYLVEVYT